MEYYLNIKTSVSKNDAAEPFKLNNPPVTVAAAVVTLYVKVNDKVVAWGSKNTLWLIPDGIVKLTTWELKAPKFTGELATNVVLVAGVLGPVTCVIPSDDTLTL